MCKQYAIGVSLVVWKAAPPLFKALRIFRKFSVVFLLSSNYIKLTNRQTSNAFDEGRHLVMKIMMKI